MNTERLINIESRLLAQEIELRALANSEPGNLELLRRQLPAIFTNVAAVTAGIRFELSGYLYATHTDTTTEQFDHE